MCSPKFPGCEQDSLIIYPKCKPGFHAFGCCICTPDCPSGMADRGAHCEKPTYVTKPILASCDANQDYDAGLCYQKCKPGYYGIGPVCWGTCPKDRPKDCGAMCGTEGFSCAMAIGDMFISVGSVIADAVSLVVTFGSSAATTGAKAAAKASAKAALKSLAKQTALNLGTKLASISVAQNKTEVKKDFKTKYPDMDPKLRAEIEAFTEKTVDAAANPESFDYESFFTDIDPTGIAAAIKSFIHPICAIGVPTATTPKLPKVDLIEKTDPDQMRKSELAKIPDVCSLTQSMKEYKEFKRYLESYNIFFKLFNPVRKSVVDSIPEGQLYSLIQKNCDLMRNDPSFIKVANTPWINWTNDQRNAAMKLVAVGSTLAPSEAQKLNNFELMGFLRGHFPLGNMKSPCDVTRTATIDNILANPYRFKSDSVGLPDKDIKSLAEKFLSPKTIEKANWNRVDLFNILTMDCNIVMEDPAYGLLVSTPPEQWTNDQRDKAIKIIAKATSNPVSDLSRPLKVQQLANKELFEFFKWNALN